MRIVVCVLLVLLASVSPSTSQQPVAPNPHFEVGEDRLVSSGPDLPLVEPYLAINPKDPNNMLAAAMVVIKPDLSGLDCAAFVTYDGGRTWTRNDFGLRNAGDAWVAYLPDGTAVLSILEITERGESALLIFRSTDGGRTWPSKPVSLGNNHDHPTLLVDRSSKQFVGSLYAVTGRSWKNSAGKGRSAIFVARSSQRTCPASPNNLPTALRFPGGGEYIGLVATPDGAFHVLWADNRTGTYQLRMATVKVKR